MDNPIKDRIDNLSRELPEEFRRAVSSVPVPERLYEIGKNHRLRIDTIGLLAELVSQFILGEMKSKAFVSAVFELCNGTHDQAADVATAVNNEIFAPIRDALRKATGAPLMAPQPPRPADAVRKPEPLIIEPLPPREVDRGQRRAGGEPPPLWVGPKQAEALPWSKATEDTPAPVITPIGIQPATAAKSGPRIADRERVGEVKPERPSLPAEAPTPAEAVADRQPTAGISAQGLGRRERMTTPEKPEPIPPPNLPVAEVEPTKVAQLPAQAERRHGLGAGPVELPQPLAPKPPPEKRPPPEAPEKYMVDPYREAVE